ncbi:MAG TPA: hypothetical protein VKU39_00025 [Streptosporangiaceae bacterium]|nr:hypothetical protein [Streptosporangiaceae bacterium]
MEQAYGARVARLRRRRRRRQLAMWAFSLCTVAALVAVAWVTVRLDRLHNTRITTTAATITRVQVPVPLIHDGPAGLSYYMLGPPWRRGCPAALSTATFTWNSGEAAMAGHVTGAAGQSVTWYGSACSGPLPGAFAGTGPRGEAYAALRAIGPAYYGMLRYTLHVTSSGAIRVGGAKAWRITYLVRYPGARLPWSAERGMLVVAGRGAGELYCVSVPGNLGTWVYTALVASLRLPVLTG